MTCEVVAGLRVMAAQLSVKQAVSIIAGWAGARVAGRRRETGAERVGESDGR